MTMLAPWQALEAGVWEQLASLLVVAFYFALGSWWEAAGYGLRTRSVAKRFTNRAANAMRRLPLVGAGPGDVALLTMAARRAIAEADLVIADLLVPQEILALVNGRLVLSRKYKGCANKAQDELHEWTLAALAQGLDVVRLKGGDPFLYGRGAEEIAVFRRAGFAVEVIPGISSCLSAPLAAGIPVTTRGVADQIIVATGHGMNDTVPRDVAPYYAGRTSVFLMSVSRMTQLMERLASPQLGYPSSTPVAVIEKATTSKQRTVRGTVESIARICEAEAVESPATIVVGRAVDALGDASTAYTAGSGCVRFEPLNQWAA
ncbi:Uroporphyrinogen-III C-methyltransferase [Hondaea fermentalgiana]|uniref:Uroporphyrinogen-III C-methyltransferase n=1 Tax=Hondaea fermentalgiana TaxID=2315210 RepID=A0A2R5G3R0_9STRA|nr:Uroporphyrinogen-III C-methyltransferase [Hondaea fermentalgiana]|eukprot:GBG25677.1 Uroporphyrinogen-III C-methyltransferase [Hondaea fermentalgiana]